MRRLAIAVLAALALVTGGLAIQASGTDTSSVAVDDATVKSGSPNANFGTADPLELKYNNRETFLRFTVSGLDGSVLAAHVKLYMTSSLGSGSAVGMHTVSGSWTETGITWNTKPSQPTLLSTLSGPQSANTWLSFDASGIVTGDGTYEFGFTTGSTATLTFASSEASTNKPALDITTDGPATTTTAAAATTTTTTVVPGGGSLVFSDEFTNQLTESGTGIQGFVDPNKWQSGYQWCYRAHLGEYSGVPEGACTPTSNSGNQNLAAYYWKQVQQPGDGTLHLVSQKAPAGYNDGMGHSVAQGDWVTGMVSSYNKFSFTYGYIECRVKLTEAKGGWPACWMLKQATNVEWPPEFDIMEIFEPTQAITQTHSNVWWPPEDSDDNSLAATSLTNPTGWHTYGMLWTSTQLKWYLDGTLWRTYSTAANIAQVPMYIHINQAVGGPCCFMANPDANTPSPFTMLVDYVRVYQ